MAISVNPAADQHITAAAVVGEDENYAFYIDG